jgi:hypothetical protein
MRNRIIFLYVIATIFVACRGERTVVENQSGTVTENVVAAPPANLSGKTVDDLIPLIAPVAKRCEVGTRLDAKGVVSAKATTIESDVPMYLTIWLAESPEDLQVSMRVRDSNGDDVANVTRPAKGTKVVTLKLDQKLDAGNYRVEGVWGGNVACEQDIEITD